MFDLVVSLVSAVWDVFRESSFYLLLGFSVAGLLHVALPAGLLARLLGAPRIRSTVAASLIGVPLPLCSCSVLPTAIALRRKGASRGATVSFLISTPETGVDSIALTWGLLGWVMALFRPLAALVTAIAAGVAVELFGGTMPLAVDQGDPDTDEAALEGAHDCCDDDHDALDGAAASDDGPRGPLGALRYAFVELLDDMSHWLMLGLVLAAIVTAFVPAELVEGLMGGRVLPLFVMAAIGVPVYICASASTPIAASLMLKGLSPGAALVFLLTGPATNLGSLTVLVRYLGRRVVAIYLAMVVVFSIAFGAMLDLLFLKIGFVPIVTLAGEASGWMPGWLMTVSAVLFLGLLGASLWRAPVPSEFVALIRRLGELSGLRLTRARLGGVLIALACLAWVETAALIVRPGEAGAVLRFGRLVSAELEPGLHWHLPAPLGKGMVLATDASRIVELGFRSDPEAQRRGRTSELVAEAYYLTGDENLLDLRQVVEYRVADARAFAFRILDPDGLVRSVARAATLETVRSRGIDAIYTHARVPMEAELLRRVQEELDGYGVGIEVMRVSLVSVHSPGDVHFDFRDVASAREDALTAVEKARAYEEETVPLARGRAAELRLEALAFRGAEVARAEGEAAAFSALASAVGVSAEVTRERLYLETLEEVLSGGVRKVVRPTGAGAGQVDLWIPRGDRAAVSAPQARGAPEEPRAPESPFTRAMKQAQMRGGGR